MATFWNPTRTGWSAQAATVPDPSGTGGNVTSRTAALYQAVAAIGQLREGATCWDSHLRNPDSDHPRGLACDLFFHPMTPPTSPAAGTSMAWPVSKE